MAASTLTRSKSQLAASIQGAAAVSLPDDLIFDILSKTPVKALCRFRCVSRNWCAIISAPVFVATQRSSLAEPLLVTRYFPPEGTTQGSGNLVLMDMDGNAVKMIKGAGGFRVLCTSLDDLIFVTSGVHHHRLINPAATMDEVLVTFPEIFNRVPTIYGFGRTAPSGAYKIVHLSNRLTVTACEVLTLGDNAGWRKTTTLPPPTPPETYLLDSPPVAVNGVMYFLAYCIHQSDMLLCFDLEEEEEWRVMEGPPGVTGAEGLQKRIAKEVHVTELNGDVCMVQPVTTRDEPPCTNIWLLKDFDRGIWTKAFTVRFPNPVRPLRVILRCDGGKLLFYVKTANHRELELHVYDPSAGTCTHVMTMPNYHFNTAIGLCRSL